MADRAERSLSLGAIAGEYDRLWPGPPPAAVAGHVIAVEPDDRMRSALADRSPGAEALAGRGEAIPLPDAVPGTFHKFETATFRFMRAMTVPDLVEWLTIYSRVITASDAEQAAGRTRAPSSPAAATRR